MRAEPSQAAPPPAVFLHIGEPKSGTTYLQDILWTNRPALAAQGIELPGAGPRAHYFAAQDLRGVPQSDTDPGPRWDGAWEAVARKARRVEGTAVVSHELMVGVKDDVAQRAVRDVGIERAHIVLTVRDFATLLPAEWQETVKHRNSRPWRHWLRDIQRGSEQLSHHRGRWFWRAHDTLGLLRRWGVDLPPERVHVVTVPPRGSDRDLLWRRFAGVIGADPASVTTDGATSNASLGIAEVEMLRRLNRRISADIPPWFYYREVKDALARDVLAARTPSARLQLPDELFGWAETQAGLVVDGIRAAGYDVVGDLDELRPAPSRGDAGSDPADVTTQQLLDAALASMSGLLQNRYENEQTQWTQRALQRVSQSPVGALWRTRRRGR